MTQSVHGKKNIRFGFRFFFIFYDWYFKCQSRCIYIVMFAGIFRKWKHEWRKRKHKRRTKVYLCFYYIYWWYFLYQFRSLLDSLLMNRILCLWIGWQYNIPHELAWERERGLLSAKTVWSTNLQCQKFYEWICLFKGAGHWV